MRGRQGGGGPGRGGQGGRDRNRGRDGGPSRKAPPRQETRRREAPPPRPPAPPPPGARLADVEELTVRIEKLVAGGEGLARFEGVPLFVPRSAPGDLLRVRIAERRPDYGRAEILEILEPGPARRPDPVPELSRSGVCDLQHLDDRAQPLLRAAAVRETLERIGRLTVSAATPLITGEPWGYRLRTQLHTELDPQAGGVRVGYYARGTNEVIPVARCPLLVPELEELLAELPNVLGPDAPRRLDLAAGDGGAVTVAPLVPGLPHGELSSKVADITYAYDARCFFQSHRGLLPRLVETVVGAWEGETAVDLYAGVGLFSLPLARRYRRVIAVEADQIGARYARVNTRRNRLPGVEVVNQVVESWLPALLAGVDRVVLDPPRGGLTPRARNLLMARRPARLTYVSCHPAALARDLRQLQEGYAIESLAFVDLFPQTGHMEVVVQMGVRA
jgi:23S rRNA (uracil1939-C5)-methyltransferase